MLKKGILVLIILVLAGVLAGCGKGSEYVGKWVTIYVNKWNGDKIIKRLEIKRNGENFLVNENIESYKDTAKSPGDMGKRVAWHVSTGNPITATLKDGILTINAMPIFTFVKADGTILGPTGEVYKRETPKLLKQYKQEATEAFKKDNPKVTIIEE